MRSASPAEDAGGVARETGRARRDVPEEPSAHRREPEEDGREQVRLRGMGKLAPAQRRDALRGDRQGHALTDGS